MIYKTNRGFAVLAVLVAIAIIMILYFVQIGILFGPAGSYESKGIEDHPWVLEELLAAKDEDIKLPRKPKLSPEKSLTLKLAVSLDDAKRGNVNITFDTNGRIHSEWKCTYMSDTISYQIAATMDGNIVTKRTYRDENGKDKSRLFFIGKGSYTKSPIDTSVNNLGEKGTAWLTGWLKPDKSIDGHITITTNQQWTGVYNISRAD